jgi:hypothetical protein
LFFFLFSLLVLFPLLILLLELIVDPGPTPALLDALLSLNKQLDIEILVLIIIFAKRLLC